MPNSYDDLVARAQHIREVRVLQGHTDYIDSVAFSPNGHLLASGSGDGDHTVRLWEVESGQPIRILQGHSSRIWQIMFSPNGHLLASGSMDQTVRLWDVESNREVSVFKELYPEGLAFSPDGRLLASGMPDNAIRLWDVESGQSIHILQGHIGKVWSIAFSPDGRLLASGSTDNSIRLWEVGSGQQLRILQGHSSGIPGLVFSPDGRFLASGSHDQTLRLWEVETGGEIRTLRGHTNIVVHIAISPDGRVLASPSTDHTSRLWDIENGKEICTLQGHSNEVYCDAISPDGRLLASGSADNSIRLWDISSLDIGPKKATKPTQPTIVRATMTRPLQTQLNTHALCHVTPRDVPIERTASWLRGTSAAGWSLPFALAHDLGLVLTQPASQLTLAKPSHLPFDEDTTTYLAFLHRVMAHPLVRELPLWKPPLSDVVLGIVLARLVEGLNLPEMYQIPSGPDGVLLTRLLGEKLTTSNPADLWQKTSLEQRPSWRKLLPLEALGRIERNLALLDREELRFLIRYGSPLAGAPDPRDLFDLLALTNLPANARLALTQTLKLLPRVSETRTVGGVQTYPEGGYEGLARKGSLDSLLPTEIAYPRDLFLHRVLNHEALYYGRERPRDRRRELAYIVMQVGYGLGGDGQILARALLLALAQAMRKRGYEVLYSIAGSELSEPQALDKPGDVARVLYAYEPVLVEGSKILPSVAQQLRKWREKYRGRQVLWVLSEHFDADDAEDHTTMYQALRAEAGQQVWYVRIGQSKDKNQGNGHTLPPPTARYFEYWQMVETSLLWEPERARV